MQPCATTISMTKFLSLLPLPPSPIPCLPHSSPSLSLSPLSSLPSPPSSPLSSPCRLLDVQSTEGRFNHELIFYLVFEHMDLDLDQFIRQCPPPGMNELIIKVQTALVIIYYYSVLSHATIILLPSCFPPPPTLKILYETLIHTGAQLQPYNCIAAIS